MTDEDRWKPSDAERACKDAQHAVSDLIDRMHRGIGSVRLAIAYIDRGRDYIDVRGKLLDALEHMGEEVERDPPLPPEPAKPKGPCGHERMGGSYCPDCGLMVPIADTEEFLAKLKEDK